jgi:putative DNA primase/helicase
MGTAAHVNQGQRSTAADTLGAALACVRAGISVIPIARGGGKLPDVGLLPREWDERTATYRATWKPFTRRVATEEQVRQWFAGPSPPGFATIGGSVSRNLEQLDFDVRAEEVFPEWCALVEAEAPGLTYKLSVSTTPRGGYHVRYRCPGITIPGNTKLAEEPVVNPETGKEERACLIETRGEGGYAIAPGSPAEVHKSGRPYLHHSGPPLHQLPAITPQEREVLWNCAAAFDRRPVDEHEVKGAARAHSPQAGLSPGDDFNARGPDWPEILIGWELASHSGQERRWRRPGKGDGWSATTGVCFSKTHKWELLKVFTSNASPFEPGGVYSKFAVYALLNHGGDFSAAAKALAHQGYGSRPHEGNGKTHAHAERGGATGQRAQEEPWEPPDPLGGDLPVPLFPVDVLPQWQAEWVGGGRRVHADAPGPGGDARAGHHRRRARAEVSRPGPRRLGRADEPLHGRIPACRRKKNGRVPGGHRPGPAIRARGTSAHEADDCRAGQRAPHPRSQA